MSTHNEYQVVDTLKYWQNQTIELLKISNEIVRQKELVSGDFRTMNEKDVHS